VGEFRRVVAARGGDRDQAAGAPHAVGLGEDEAGIGDVVEDVEDRETV
jgi:hypothetical protein